MRPQSIIRFEQTFIATALVMAVHSVVNFSTLAARTLEVGASIAVLLIGYAFTAAIFFLFWFFISQRASNPAKWTLVSLAAIGFLDLLRFVFAANVFGPVFAFSALIRLMLCVAVAFLFCRDAVEWLRSRGQAGVIDATTFN